MNYKKLIAISFVAIFVCPTFVSFVFAQSRQLDSTYIPKDTVVVASLNVKHLLGYEPKDSKLVKQITQLVNISTGLPLIKMKQMQLVFGGETDRDIDQTLGVKFLFNEKVESDAFIKTVFGREKFEKVERKGKEYLRGGNEYMPCLYFDKERSLLMIAMEQRLLEMIDAETEDSEFAKKLMKADGDTDFYFAFKRSKTTSEFIGEVLDEFRGALSQLPFNLKDIIAEASEGEISLNLDTAEPIRIQLNADDQEGAERLQRAAEAWLALGRIGLPKCKPHAEKFLKESKTPAEISKALLSSINKTAQVIDATDVSVKDKQLVVKVELMGGLVSTIRDATKCIIHFGFRDSHHHHHHHDHHHDHAPEGGEAEADIIEIR